MKKYIIPIILICAIVMVSAACKKDSTPASIVITSPTTTAPVVCAEPHLQGIMTWTAATIDVSGTAAIPDGYVVNCSSTIDVVVIDAGNVLQVDLNPVIIRDGIWTCREKAYSKGSDGNITRDGDWSNEVSFIRSAGCFY